MSEAVTVPRKRHRNYPEDAAATSEAAPVEAAPEAAKEKPKRVRPDRAGKTTATPAAKTATKSAGKPAESAPEAPAKPKASVTKVEGSPVAIVRVEGEGGERYVFDLEWKDNTKTYAKFVPPPGSGCVGTLYVPLGTGRVRISLEAGE